MKDKEEKKKKKKRKEMFVVGRKSASNQLNSYLWLSKAKALVGQLVTGDVFFGLVSFV